MTNRRETLVYQAASEAVMEARIAIAKMLGDNCVGVPVDDVLSDAMHRAGDYAVRALHADTRRTRTVWQLLRGGDDD